MDEWKTTFHSIPDLIMLLDHEFRIVRANSAMVSSYDLPLDRILGNTCDTVKRRTEKLFARPLLERALVTGRHEEEEHYVDSLFEPSIPPNLREWGWGLP